MTPEPLMTPDEAAAYLRVGVKSIYTWSAAGKIRRLYAGGLLRFRRSDLDAFLCRHERGDRGKTAGQRHPA